MEKLAGAAGARKILVPRLKGLGEPVTCVFILKMLTFFSAFSLGPREVEGLTRTGGACGAPISLQLCVPPSPSLPPSRASVRSSLPPPNVIPSGGPGPKRESEAPIPSPQAPPRRRDAVCRRPSKQDGGG